MTFHRTCSRGVKANDKRLSGEHIGFIVPISLWFRILIMLFDLQHVAPGEEERGKHQGWSC